MLKIFHLEKDWKLISILRCTKKHVVLSLKDVRNGVPAIVKIVFRSEFDSKIYHALSALSMDYIVPIKRIQSDHNWVIIHYPLLNPLKEYIQKEGMSLPEILCLMDNISTAVSNLHEKKILHLDISPDNVYLDDDGNFLLGDFSNARRIGRKEKITSMTPCYTAPECMDGTPSYSSDLYSFAMLIFALLHNGSAYKNGQKNLTTFFSEQQKKMSANGIQYPAVLYSYFEKALSPIPSARYSDIRSFAADIQTCLKPLCEQYDYRIQLTDRKHPFYQVYTIPISPQQNTHFMVTLPEKMQPAKKYFPIVGMSAFLLIGVLLVKQLHIFHKGAINTIPSEKVNLTAEESVHKTPDADFDKYIHPPTDTPAGNVLDVSNHNANTLAELLDEDAILQDWKVLYGENNAFTSLEEIEEFPNILELYLSGNKLNSLEALGKLGELQTLILSDNCCTDLSPLSSLTRLSILDLSGNLQLSQITPLKQLKNLHLLILSDTSVPLDSIRELQTAIPECEIVY